MYCALRANILMASKTIITKLLFAMNFTEVIRYFLLRKSWCFYLIFVYFVKRTRSTNCFRLISFIWAWNSYKRFRQIVQFRNSCRIKNSLFSTKFTNINLEINLYLTLGFPFLICTI